MRAAGAHRTLLPEDGGKVGVIAIGCGIYRGDTLARKVQSMRGDGSENAAEVPKTICYEERKLLEGEARVHMGSSIMRRRHIETEGMFERLFNKVKQDGALG